MQAIPKHLLINEHPAFVRQETDTAHPHTPIPIFYIHDFPTPFCRNPLCFCQRSKLDADKLLGNIAQGSCLVLDATSLIDAGSTTGTDQPTKTLISVDLIPGIPEECQLYGHSWQITEHPDVKECTLCHIRGYCPGCSPVAPARAHPFNCSVHARQREGQR